MKIYKYTPHIVSLVFLSSFFYVCYRFFIYHEGQFFYYYKKYFIITIVLLLSSLPLFFLKEIFKKLIFNTALLLFLAFYSVEAILAIQLKNKIDDKASNFEDKRSIIEVLDDYEKEGIISYPAKYAHYSKEFDLLSFSGISNIFTVFCNENGYWATYFLIDMVLGILTLFGI